MHCSVMVLGEQKFSGEAVSVLLPGADGELEILQSHADVIVLLKAGRLIVDETEGLSHRYLVRGGIASVSSGRLIVLADSCMDESPESLANMSALIDDANQKYETSTDGPEKQALFNQLDALKHLG